MPSARSITFAALFVIGCSLLAITIASVIATALSDLLLDGFKNHLNLPGVDNLDARHHHIEKKPMIKLETGKKESEEGAGQTEGAGCALCVYVFPPLFRALLYFQVIVLGVVVLMMVAMRSKPFGREASKIKSEASEDMGSQVAERGEMSARTSREDAAAATLRGRTVLADVPGS
mmetsp:Transcript_14675/g.34805  ORF Transcript_14675/g.34805 Transcript_14675/m.34805 type:complete len:175 (+) Transcript_14675:98-622(+)